MVSLSQRLVAYYRPEAVDAGRQRWRAESRPMAFCAVMLACSVLGCERPSSMQSLQRTTDHGPQTTDHRPPTTDPTPPEPVHVLDLTGNAVDPLATNGATAKVFIFTRADCPIANRYAPEIQRLAKEFGQQGVQFYLVYPDPAATAEEIRRHMEEYGYKCGAFRDPYHRLVSRTGASITPEAAVFVPGGRMVYRGRIDDWYVDFGKARSQASRRDLKLALQAVLEGRAVDQSRTKAVGCYISDLK